MANLEFCDTHNMVAYLKKTEGSEGFHQIVDFLNASHIRYALAENLTIYVSLIQQFWQTATANTLDNGEMEITATIDGKVKIVTEASIRRHLKLEDSDGISNLPTTKNFKQLALMGSKKTAWEQFSSNIATAIICLATNKTFNFSKLIFDGMGEGSTVPVKSHHTPTGAPSTLKPPISSPSRRTTRQETKVPQPSSPPHTNVADEVASTGVDVRHGEASTTVTSLDAGQGSGNIDKTLTMPHDSPLPRGHTLGSDEGRMKHNELMDLVTKLSDRVVALDTYLKQTKKVYGANFTKLIKKVKRLEKKDKLSKSRRKLRMVLSDEEGSDSYILAQEDPSKQGRKIAQIDEDKGINLVQMGAQTQGSYGQDMEFETNFDAAKEVSTVKDVSTAKPVSTDGAAIITASVVVSTADDINLAETLVYIRRSASKDKGIAKIDEPESVQTKKKLQERQERLGYEVAVRLQEQLNEEDRQGITRVHEKASSFNVEE
ncbi:hypothetical protein Tco_0311617 [Tanacetum coccineum]